MHQRINTYEQNIQTTPTRQHQDKTTQTKSNTLYNIKQTNPTQSQNKTTYKHDHVMHNNQTTQRTRKTQSNS